MIWSGCSHRDYEPIIRPTFYEFPEDEHCYAENDDMLLGKHLLVAAVVQPGQQTRPVYLPGGCGWYDFWRGDHYHGGREVVLPAPWDRPPLLVREGSAIPLNVAEQHFAARADHRGFALFPHRTHGRFECGCFEDDGESEAYRNGKFWTWRLQVESSALELAIRIEREGTGSTEAGEISLLLPRQETRRVHLRGGSVAGDTQTETNRELRVRLTFLKYLRG